MLGNGSSAVFTNPTITISSSYDPSLFAVEPPDFNGPPAPGLPSSCSAPAIGPNSFADMQLLAPGIADSLSLGYDSSTSPAPQLLSASGGQATETFAVTVTDPALAGGGITVQTGTPWITVVSQSIPQNLDQGEIVSTDGQDWQLSNLQIHKQYVFQAVVDVAPPANPGPFLFSAPAMISVSDAGCGPPCGTVFTPSTSAGIPDTALGGAFGFSVDQPGIWTLWRKVFYITAYPGEASTLTIDQCKNGGWKAFGIFKNQGDCVSFVATNGKNPPAGK
jgi:hypothetical protein